jgi:Icc protein
MMGRAEPAPTLHYTFEVKGMQVVVVDSNGPAEPPAGFVDDAQLKWLSDLCTAADTRPLIIAVHHNVLPVGVPWLDTFMRMRNGDAFHRAILPARERIRGVFFGHVHQSITMYRDGILYTSALSSWAQIIAWPHTTDTEFDHGAEPGFSVVTVTPQQTFIRRHRYPRPG